LFAFEKHESDHCVESKLPGSESGKGLKVNLLTNVREQGLTTVDIHISFKKILYCCAGGTNLDYDTYIHRNVHIFYGQQDLLTD
jgi:hypothetical protein